MQGDFSPVNGASVDRVSADLATVNGALADEAPANNSHADGSSVDAVPVHSSPSDGSNADRAPVDNVDKPSHFAIHELSRACLEKNAAILDWFLFSVITMISDVINYEVLNSVKFCF